MAFCRYCGTQLNEGAKFCPKCGKAVGDNLSASQQHANLSQLYNEEKEEKGLGIWFKSILLAFWPIGLIVALIFKLRKKNIKARDAFQFSIAGIIASFSLYFINNCATNTQVEKTTKAIMIEKSIENGIVLDVKDITLVHKNGNEYTGIAECEVNGEKVQYSLKVTYDGINVVAEWVPSDIEIENSEVEEEESYVPSSVSDDAKEEGYNAGYQMGFQFGHLNENMNDNIQIAYCGVYGDAPSSPEERKQYNIFAENFKRGYRDGRNAR